MLRVDLKAMTVMGRNGFRRRTVKGFRVEI
jgi:hypothetical protein